MVEQVAQEYKDRLKVVGANIDGAVDTASNLGIMSIPALVFFKGGQEVHRIIGPLSKQKLLDEIKNKLGA